MATSTSVRHTGSFTWRIEGYSGLSAVVGECIESPPFALCGHVWQVTLYPGGASDDSQGHLSVYLANISAHSVRAKYTLRVCHLDVEYDSSEVRTFKATEVHTDKVYSHLWGCSKLIPMAAMLQCGDVVVFEVTLTVYDPLKHGKVVVSHVKRRRTDAGVGEKV